MHTRVTIVAVALMGAGCLDSQKGAVQVGDDGDSVTTIDDGAPPDAGADATDDTLPTLPCGCPEGEVYRDPTSACVPTLDLGCGPACDDDQDCGPGMLCDPCAASSRCDTRDCRPSCAVAPGPGAPVPDPLRVAPTELAADGPWHVEVLGTTFYVGALGNRVRVGVTELEMGEHRADGSCRMSVQLPDDTAPGAHALWVSQYDMGPPWALAGIVHVGASTACAQPGFPCSADAHCCTAPSVDMSCEDARCMRR